MKYALIGCGRIAPNHIEAALNSNLEIAALCDINEGQIKALKTQYNLPESVKEYTDYKLMLQEVELGLIGIATESGYHAGIALDCLDYGCNLIIEKPIALSIEDADAIISKAKVKGVVVSASHQNRFNKSVQRMRQELEAGSFGKLLHGTANILWKRDKPYYDQAPWRGTWALDGGTLMNQGIHNIDLLRWTMGGEIEEVFAYTDNLNHEYIEAEDLGLAIIKFKNGGYGLVQGTSNLFHDDLEETLYLFGSDGVVKLGGKSVNIIEEWAFKDNKEDPEVVKSKYKELPDNVYGFGHNTLYEDVIDAIKTGREPYITAKDGRDALELVLAIYKSAAEGKPVKLPLESCSTLDFVGRFDR